MRLSSRDGACEAHGQCEIVDEGLFPLDEDGFTTIPADGIEVPAEQESTAQRGVDACPLQVLKLG